MTMQRDPGRALAAWLEAEAPDRAPTELVEASRARVSATGQRAGWLAGLRVGDTGSVARLVLVGAALLAASLVGLAVAGSLTGPARTDLGIFEPFAGRIVFADAPGLRGADETTLGAPDTVTRIEVDTTGLVPLGWTRDGTRLLAMRPPLDGQPQEWHLLVLASDGTETEVTERPVARLNGATISPDGTRVVFAGSPDAIIGACCTPSSLYAVDAAGGTPVLLRTGDDGMIQAPSFSPDGSQIAFVEGRGDNSNSVWVIDADGTGAHRIVNNELDAVAPGHVRGLAWSPRGDAIAVGLGYTGPIYTVAPDGSGFKAVIQDGVYPYWSPDGTRIAYTATCGNPVDYCGLAVADADGGNAAEYSFGASGPWHPGLHPETLPAPSGSPVASTGPVPSATAAPASVAVPDMPLTLVSPTNGFSMRRPAHDEPPSVPTTTWDAAGSVEPPEEALDSFRTGLDAVFAGVSAAVPDGVTPDDLIDAWRTATADDSASCGLPWAAESQTTIDGQAAAVWHGDQAESSCQDRWTKRYAAWVVEGGRVYLFTLAYNGGWGAPAPGSLQRDDDARAVFDAFLATIDLTPQTAAPKPAWSAPSPRLPLLARGSFSTPSVSVTITAVADGTTARGGLVLGPGDRAAGAVIPGGKQLECTRTSDGGLLLIGYREGEGFGALVIETGGSSAVIWSDPQTTAASCLEYLDSRLALGIDANGPQLEPYDGVLQLGVEATPPADLPRLASGTFGIAGEWAIELDASGEGSGVIGRMLARNGDTAFTTDLQCARTTADGLLLLGGYTTEGNGLSPTGTLAGIVIDSNGGTRATVLAQKGGPVSDAPDCLAYLDEQLGRSPVLEPVDGSVDVGP